MWERWRDN
jgi:hypothetical protein